MKKYALVVGIGVYDDPEITNLSFAAQDAQDIAACLRHVCGFEDVRLLVSDGDLEPDHVNIVDALHNIAPLTSKDDLFLLYFAGHGIQTRAGTNGTAVGKPFSSLSLRLLQFGSELLA